VRLKARERAREKEREKERGVERIDKLYDLFCAEATKCSVAADVGDRTKIV